MKLAPFAVSMLLPPPRPMIKSIPASRATATQRSTSTVVGFSRTSSKTVTCKPGGFEEADRPRRMPGGRDAFVRHEQHALRAEFARQFAHALQRILAENHPRPRLEIEAVQSQECGRVMRMHGQETLRACSFKRRLRHECAHA